MNFAIVLCAEPKVQLNKQSSIQIYHLLGDQSPIMKKACTDLQKMYNRMDSVCRRAYLLLKRTWWITYANVTALFHNLRMTWCVIFVYPETSWSFIIWNERTEFSTLRNQIIHLRYRDDEFRTYLSQKGYLVYCNEISSVRSQRG